MTQFCWAKFFVRWSLLSWVVRVNCLSCVSELPPMLLGYFASSFFCLALGESPACNMTRFCLRWVLLSWSLLSRFLLDFKFVELGFVELSFVSIKVCEVTRFCRVGFGRPKCATWLSFVEMSFVSKSVRQDSILLSWVLLNLSLLSWNMLSCRFLVNYRPYFYSGLDFVVLSFVEYNLTKFNTTKSCWVVLNGSWLTWSLLSWSVQAIFRTHCCSTWLLFAVGRLPMRAMSQFCCWVLLNSIACVCRDSFLWS